MHPPGKYEEPSGGLKRLSENAIEDCGNIVCEVAVMFFLIF
jgi:hypothetical protein